MNINRKLLKQLEAQFGGNWSCSCRTPFDPGRFEILSEKEGSFLAHYVCSVCGREQMLAAAVTTDANSRSSLPLEIVDQEILTPNDVLDIRAEIKKTPLKKLKNWLRYNTRETSSTATDVDTLLRFSPE